jgi:hypothetical protein
VEKGQVFVFTAVNTPLWSSACDAMLTCRGVKTFQRNCWRWRQCVPSKYWYSQISSATTCRWSATWSRTWAYCQGVCVCVCVCVCVLSREEVGVACSTCMERKNYVHNCDTNIWMEETKEQIINSEETGSGEVRIRFSWMRAGHSSCLLWTWQLMFEIL